MYASLPLPINKGGIFYIIFGIINKYFETATLFLLWSLIELINEHTIQNIFLWEQSEQI